MITIRPELITAVQTPDGMRASLQTAIELEHATIPTYLYTYYSLIQGMDPTADDVASLIRSVAMDEMAHFASACNLLNAVGGSPRIYFVGFVPDFPQPLPGSIHPTLQVHLAQFSPKHVQDVFMEIEEPENTLQFKTAAFLAAEPPATIGRFYGAIRDQIRAAGDAAITGDHSRQVVVASLNVTPIRNAADAVAAIDRIVEEGEGNEVSPLADRNSAELAHYYRFAQIAKQGRLLPNPDATPQTPPIDRFLYHKETLVVPANCVYPLRRNPKVAQLPPGSTAAKQTEKWNAQYTEILRMLHDGFNGKPDQVNSAINAMMQLGFAASGLVATVLDDGSHAAPTFEFQQ